MLSRDVPLIRYAAPEPDERFGSERSEVFVEGKSWGFVHKMPNLENAYALERNEFVTTEPYYMREEAIEAVKHMAIQMLVALDDQFAGRITAGLPPPPGSFFPCIECGEPTRIIVNGVYICLRCLN